MKTARVFAALGIAVCCILAGIQPVYAQEKEKVQFEPASDNLTKIFLKLANSLERTGSPEAYIRFVMSEHKRVDKKFAHITGDDDGSSRPAYLTDEQMELLIGNWKKLEKPLQLEALCREAGSYMRHAIRGSWNKSVDELVNEEIGLKASEKAQYRALLAGGDYFKKSQLLTVKRFYASGAFDKLSQEGKEAISFRTWNGQRSPEQRVEIRRNKKGGTSTVSIFNEYQKKLVADKQGVNSNVLMDMLVDGLLLNEKEVDLGKLEWHEKDAIRYSHLIKASFEKRLNYTDQKLSPEGAKRVKAAMKRMVEHLVVIARSELFAWMREDLANRKLAKK